MAYIRVLGIWMALEGLWLFETDWVRPAKLGHDAIGLALALIKLFPRRTTMRNNTTVNE